MYPMAHKLITMWTCLVGTVLIRIKVTKELKIEWRISYPKQKVMNMNPITAHMTCLARMAASFSAPFKTYGSLVDALNKKPTGMATSSDRVYLKLSGVKPVTSASCWIAGSHGMCGRESTNESHGMDGSNFMFASPFILCAHAIQKKPYVVSDGIEVLVSKTYQGP